MEDRFAYRRSADDGTVETADWSGVRRRGLVPHFHGDIQVAFVARGARRFAIAGVAVTVPAGYAVAIAPFTVHRADPNADPATVSTNFYLPATAAPPRGWIVARCAAIDCAAARDLAARLPEARRDAFLEDALAALELGVGGAARALGFSREHFARRFAAVTGLAPQAYALCRRLDAGRALLREGRAPIDAALGAGFADQSHFGRAFLRHFGTSPGRYRRMMGASHSF